MSRRKKKNNSKIDMIIESYQDNPQAIPLYVLADISKEKGDTYNRIIKSEFSGYDNIYGRKRLSKNPIENDVNPITTDSTLVDLQNAYFKEQKEKRKAENLYAKKHLEWTEAYLAYVNAREAFNNLNKKLINIKSDINKHDSTSKAILKEIQKASKDSIEFDSVLLVHRTATIKQLREYQKRHMIVTEIDAPYQYQIGVADEVFDKCNNFIKLPYYLEKNDLSFEEKSAVAFANMVFYFVINNIDHKAIFSDELISKILKFNGLDS